MIWLWCKSRFMCRFQNRGHTSMECCICCEQFCRPGEQVLTSCAHTFHRQCLDSWEKFSNRCRCCPVCRTQDYRRKRIEHGHRLHLNHCATLIQTHWRRCLAKKRFQSMWACAPKPLQLGLQQRWLQNRLAQKSDNLITAIYKSSVGDLDEFFAKLDQDIQSARLVYEEADKHVASCRHKETGPLMLTQPADDTGSNCCMETHGMSIDWNQILDVVRSRGTDDCPICMLSLSKKAAPVTYSLLSCSHAFHQKCIASFEAFEHARGGTPACPVCRNPYTRRDQTAP